MAEKNKSWKEKGIQAWNDMKSTFSNPETRQEISEKVAKENEAFNKEVEELRKKHPSQGNFEQAVYRKIQDAYDEETKQRWRDLITKKPASNKNNKVDVKNNNITQPQAQVDNTQVDNTQIDNTQIDNNTTKEKPTSFKENIVTAANKVKESASDVANNVVEGIKGNKEDTTSTDDTTTTDDTITTDDTTTTTAPETTLTKESAWNDYNKKEGTAKGLFENFNTLGMTAEEARKEFLSKITTPSDAAKKAFKEIYGVDLVVTDDDDKDKNKKYKSSMYGIIDAMKNGDIDPSTGVYFMLDALSKAARNTGIDIGNIGAQFSGGTVRNDYQDSLWSQRRDKMFENEMTSELNKQEGTDKEMEYNLAKEDLIGKGLTNEQADLALEASRTFKDKAEEFRKAGNDTMADLYALVGSAATKEVGPEELAAIAASNVLNTTEGKEAVDEIINAFTGLVGTIGSTLGGINEVLSFFTDWKNKKNK